jgi:hypothetical protein
VPCDVAVLDDTIDRLHHDLAIPADDAGKWQLSARDRLCGQLYAAPHHF